MSFALKIAFSNFFWLRKKLLSLCGPHILINLLIALNHRMVVLEALKKWFLCISSTKWLFCKKLKLMKICLLHCKNVHLLERKHFSCSWALLLKLHLATFSDWERSFEHLWPSHSHYLLSCTKHRIGVLRSSKEVISCI